MLACKEADRGEIIVKLKQACIDTVFSSSFMPSSKVKFHLLDSTAGLEMTKAETEASRRQDEDNDMLHFKRHELISC